ncbi:hypothetical protein [Asticcacaulis machinosus]|uniref:Uncharacterized protein n=1 Tax=Asticcacaulis machinosus TaxID=2984211 RepID=A0ABT5HHQ0_9CAUL|nr:hypothetical protein [Asticcacaulis machinosus]MDC7675114.1 hypothetical protein [Asticcacaulis machinosus]
MSSLKVWGLGLIAMSIMGAFGVRERLIAIETGIRTQVDEALKAEGIDDVDAVVDGQAVTLKLKDGATPPDGRQRLRDAKSVVMSLDNGLPGNYTDVNLPEVGPQRLSLKGQGGPIFGPVTRVTLTPVSVRDHAPAVMTATDEAAAEVTTEALPAATGRVATVVTQDAPHPAHRAVSAADVATDTYGPAPKKPVVPAYMQDLPPSQNKGKVMTTDYHGDDVTSPGNS